MQRYFSTKRLDNQLFLKEEDYYHIKVVMRMKSMDQIIVVYQETPYLCHLQIQDDDLSILIDEELEVMNETIPYVRLIIPVLKEQKLDYILQKATELGASEIVFYQAIRSVVKINDIDKKIIRWQRILKEASEQSHRNTIPKITGIYKIKELHDLDGVKFLCSTREKTENIKKVLKKINVCDKINVVIGPEGGLEEGEESALLQSEFLPITLGNRIMRVETVPLFIMSVINYEYME